LSLKEEEEEEEEEEDVCPTCSGTAVDSRGGNI